MNGLEGRVAVVTGGANGIGRAITQRLVQEGVRVSVLDIQSTNDLPAHVMQVRCDVSAEDQVEAAIRQTVEAFGRLDILINNAGVNAYFDAASMTGDDWDRFMGVDFKAVWLCAKHSIPELKRNQGVIINIASIHAFMSTRGMFPYAGAKSGVVGLTRSLALDLGKTGVRVIAVCPGWIRTRSIDDWLQNHAEPEAALRELLDRHPIGRIGKPEEVAGLVAFLASEDASFITGVPILVDGGLSARFAI